jgi:hypothetical protein
LTLDSELSWKMISQVVKTVSVNGIEAKRLPSTSPVLAAAAA